MSNRGARNYHAIKKHEDLKSQIGKLHRATIKVQEKKLLKLAYQPYKVNNSLINLAADNEAKEKIFLLDLYREKNVYLDLLKDIMVWVDSTSTKVLLTADICWREFFVGHDLANLFVYYPAEYHPEHDVEPFYDYLEQRYKLKRVDLSDI